MSNDRMIVRLRDRLVGSAIDWRVRIEDGKGGPRVIDAVRLAMVSAIDGLAGGAVLTHASDGVACAAVTSDTDSDYIDAQVTIGDDVTASFAPGWYQIVISGRGEDGNWRVERVAELRLHANPSSPYG